MRMIAAVLMLLPVLAHAGVYKCVVNGKVEYADQPCAASARNVDALEDRVTPDQQMQRQQQSAKERRERNGIERRENADFSARQRAMEQQIDNEARADQAKERQRQSRCSGLEREMKWNERDIARYQQFGWQRPLTQQETELKRNRESYDRDCR